MIVFKGKLLGISGVWLFLGLLLNVEIAIGQKSVMAIAMDIPFIGPAVSIDGKSMVYYELHLTNFSKDSIHFNKLEVISIDKPVELYSCTGKDLHDRLSELGVSKERDKGFLLPGSTRVLYLEHEIPTENNIGAKHRLTLSLEGKSYTITGGKVNFSNRAPIVLGAPLKSGPWAAIYDPKWQRGHRRVIYTLDGKARIPGRFAIDFMKLDNDGKTATGDGNQTTNWYGYSADVLAVSDGEVAAVRTDFEDSKYIDQHPRYNAINATGNYIALHIGNGNYVFYEHLKAGSIRVKPGQKVKKGEVVASLGFTGQATGPHLHFHVANTNSPLGAEGVPFEFEEFTVLGAYNDFGDFGKKPWQRLKKSNNSTVIKERPLPNAVIKFK